MPKIRGLSQTEPRGQGDASWGACAQTRDASKNTISVGFYRFPKLPQLPSEVGLRKTGHTPDVRASEFQLVFGALPKLGSP